jgi:hypothetical protein
MCRIRGSSRRSCRLSNTRLSPALESCWRQHRTGRPAGLSGYARCLGRFSLLFHNKNGGGVTLLIYNQSDSARASGHAYSSPYFRIDAAKGGALHERGLS